mgnify:CR=1 FL=1
MKKLAVLIAILMIGGIGMQCGNNEKKTVNSKELGATEKIEPTLINTIDLRKAGKSNRMLLGDLDGDGRMEILMMQPDTGFDDRYYPHSVNCLTAFDLEGNILWQNGNPDPFMPGSGSDIPAQIYDIDQDGYNEVLCVMKDKFCILDGRTGELKKSYDLPDPDAHDCIVIANFSGNEKPQDIVLKNRYNKLWVMDKDFNLLWTFEGNIGHYPWPYDFDGDGRDSLIAGYNVLDYNGKLQFRIDMKDHADCIWVGDLDQDPTNGMEIVVGGQDTTAYNWKGELLWRYTGTIESQNIALGNFRPDLPGTEVGGLDRIDRSENGVDGMFLINYKGEELYKEKRTTRGWSTITTMIHNWDGKGSDHLLSYRRGAGIMPGIYDGYMNPITTFPVDGHVMWADLIGDGRPQVIIYTDDKAYIYANGQVDLSKAVINEPRPQPKRLYNWTRYWGSEMPVSRYAVNYVTREFKNSDVHQWAAKYVEDNKSLMADENEPITRADFTVLLVKALGLNAYVNTNFVDVKPTDYYYDAVGIVRKLGIVENSENNRFEPAMHITNKDMADMTYNALKKLGKEDVIERLKNKNMEEIQKNHTKFIGKATRKDAAKIIYEITK